jgi:hypothetical protein
MKEFMLLVRNEADHQDSWTPERHRQFLLGCESYIGSLTAGGKLISAQPLAREGAMVSGSKGEWATGPFSATREVIVGYYHIRAADLGEAIGIAKGNPEFEFSRTARVEVRPVKTGEPDTGFIYPK